MNRYTVTQMVATARSHSKEVEAKGKFCSKHELDKLKKIAGKENKAL